MQSLFPALPFEAGGTNETDEQKLRRECKLWLKDAVLFETEVNLSDRATCGIMEHCFGVALKLLNRLQSS